MLTTPCLSQHHHMKGETPLHEASRYGHPDVVEALLKRGADHSQRDNTVCHHAHHAHHAHHTPHTRAHPNGLWFHFGLLKAGLNLPPPPVFFCLFFSLFGQGWTALHIAASEGRHEVVSVLINAGADVNSCDRNVSYAASLHLSPANSLPPPPPCTGLLHMMHSHNGTWGTNNARAPLLSILHASLEMKIRCECCWRHRQSTSKPKTTR